MELKFIDAFCRKYKKECLYLIFGGISFFISFFTFMFFIKVIQLEAVFSNIFAWIFSMTFAFIVDKIYVFESKVINIKKIIGESSKFLTGRAISFFVEEILLYVFITILCCEAVPVKLLTSVVVTIMNYIVSKFWVFS